MKTILFTVLALVASGAVACDKQGALHSQASIAAMGKAAKASFRWDAQTKTMPDQMRAHLMESYAQADACLKGAPRVIDFYVDTKRIGQVGVDGYFVPTDPAYDLPARPGLHFSAKITVK